MIFLINFLFILTIFALIVKAGEVWGGDGITYVENYQAPQPGGEKKIRLITFVGDQKGYNLTAREWSRYALSDATCGKTIDPIDPTNFTLFGPCSTSVEYHNEYLIASCVNDTDSYADIYFNPFDNGSTASIVTFGNVYAGFDTDDKPLTTSELVHGFITTTADHAGAVINCYNSSSRT